MDTPKELDPELKSYHVVELSGSSGTIHLDILTRDWTLFEKFWACAEKEGLFDTLIVKKTVLRNAE